MTDFPTYTYTEADLLRLPDPVPSKQTAVVLGVKSSALRMMVRRGALDPPVSVGTNQAWYSREAVARAWRRRQPEQVRQIQAEHGPKSVAEQASQMTEMVPKNGEQGAAVAGPEGAAAFVREAVRQMADSQQAQAEAVTKWIGQGAQQQDALREEIAGLAAAVQTLTQELAQERARRESEQAAPQMAGRGRATTFWGRLWGGGKADAGD